MGSAMDLHFMVIMEIAAPLEQWITSTGDTLCDLFHLELSLGDMNLAHCGEEVALMCSILLESCNPIFFMAV